MRSVDDNGGVRALRWIGGGALTMVTLLFLASIGGGMLIAGWFLVPLHWWSARGVGPVATGWWAFLAAASVSEMAMMLTYLLTVNGIAVALVGVLVFVGTGMAFVVARSRRVATE